MFPALSVIVREALRAPPAVGVKVTKMLQLPLAANDAPQVVVDEKSPALLPPNAMLAMESATDPEFESVTVCVALLVPTF